MRFGGLGISELIAILCMLLLAVVVLAIAYFVIRKAVYDALVMYHQEIEGKRL